MKIDINKKTLIWAIEKAGRDWRHFGCPSMFPTDNWINGTKKPTIDKLKSFAKEINIPLYFLFLNSSTLKKTPILFFKSGKGLVEKIEHNIRNIIYVLEQRQDWLKEYFKKNDFYDLKFVGSWAYCGKKFDAKNMDDIIRDMRSLFGNGMYIKEDSIRYFTNTQEVLKTLIKASENQRINIVFSNKDNKNKKIDVETCRGFVLADEWAPFIFINSEDNVIAQIFTLVYSLVHLLMGRSTGYDLKNLRPADDFLEQFCGKVTIRFLFGKTQFKNDWINNFKTEKILREDDLYTKVTNELGTPFTSYIISAVQENQLSYRDAYNLTNMTGNEFENFISKAKYHN